MERRPTPFLQTVKPMRKPIIEHVYARASQTPRSVSSFPRMDHARQLSLGIPIDLNCFERDSLEVQWRRRFDEGDSYFTALSDEWGEGVRQVFRHLPELRW